MKKTLVIKSIVLIFFLPLFLKAETVSGRVTGRVVDQQNRGLAGVQVVIPELNLAAVSNEDGIYHFELARPGLYQIEFFKDRFLPAASKKFNYSGESELLVPDVALEPNPQESVVVTGTLTPTLYAAVPVKTFQRSRLEIERSGALNLSEGLEIVPGLRVENNCQNCNFTSLRINGMGGEYTQLLFNGLANVSALASVYALEQIPANMIEKFEVIKGGASTLYGSSAIGGVVNIVLRKPERNGGRLNFMGGYALSEPTMNVGFNYDFVKDHSGLSFFSSYTNNRAVDFDGDGFSDIGQMTNLSFGTNFISNFDRLNSTLRLSMFFINEQRRGGDRLDLPQHFAEIAESADTRRFDFSLNWEQVFVPGSTLNFDLAYSNTYRDTYYGSGRDPNAYGYTKNPMAVLNLRYANSNLNRHGLILGLSLQTDRIDDSAPAYDSFINEKYHSLAFFAQDEFEVFDEFKLLLGVRAEKHSQLEKMILSPRAGLSYSGISNLVFRLSYSTGFRAPQVFDEDLHITQVGGEGMLIRNAPGLEPELSRSFSAGVDFGRIIGRSLWQFSLNGFYNKLDQVFMLTNLGLEDEPGLLFHRINGSGARILGLETELGFKTSPGLGFYANLTWQRNLYDEPEPDFASREMFRTPKLYGSLRLEYLFLSALETTLSARYTGSMKIPHWSGFIPEDRLETTKPYWVLDLNLKKGFPVGREDRLELGIDALNLFNWFQPDLDRGPERDSGYVYGPRLPRTVRLRIGYSF